MFLVGGGLSLLIIKEVFVFARGLLNGKATEERREAMVEVVKILQQQTNILQLHTQKFEDIRIINEKNGEKLGKLCFDLNTAMERQINFHRTTTEKLHDLKDKI